MRKTDEGPTPEERGVGPSSDGDCSTSPGTRQPLMGAERLPVIVAETVIVQRRRGTGVLAEAVRAVVLVVVRRNRVRRSTGLFGRLNLDVAVTVDTGTGRDQ